MQDRRWYFLKDEWLRQYLEQAGHWPLRFDGTELSELLKDEPLGRQAAAVLSHCDWLALIMEWRRVHPDAPPTAADCMRHISKLFDETYRQLLEIWEHDSEMVRLLKMPPSDTR